MARVLMQQADNYPQLLTSTRRAAENLVAMNKQRSVAWVTDIVEMEKTTDYTCDPKYSAVWTKLMAHQKEFTEILSDYSKSTYLKMNDGLGTVDVRHLRSGGAVVQEAFDIKMRLMAYWKIVLKRLVDSMALHLLFSIQNMINKEMEAEIIQVIVGAEGKGLERMLEESPTVAEKRERLKSISKI